MNWHLVDRLIEDALIEDIGFGDITTEATIDPEHRSKATMVAKHAGVLVGIDVARRVFHTVDDKLKIEGNIQDGTLVQPGDRLAVVTGCTRSILSAERVALNLVQHMSGIATMTRRAVDQVQEPEMVAITDTRKTLPGLRMLEKYAVRMGGGVNHRFRLDDAVMIKDNHIAAAGGIAAAVTRAREHVGHMVKIEVEVETLEQVEEAVDNDVDVILLDNMTSTELTAAVALIPEEIITEASGGITIDAVSDIAGTGVNVISIGWLTHSAPALDISLTIQGSVKHAADEAQENTR